MHTMRIDVLTLFPDMFTGVLDSSIQARAAESGRVACHVLARQAPGEVVAARHRPADEWQHEL